MKATHYEQSLQHDIEHIRCKVSEMSNLDEMAIRRSLEALLSRDRRLAYSIIFRDHYIDILEKELDKLCLQFIIRQQPVAGHLRFVYSTMKITRDLERIGDCAEGIARQVLKLDVIKELPLSDKFVYIANLSISMLQGAMQAFLDQDVQKADFVMEIEAQADDARQDINAHLLQMRRQRKIPIEALTALMTVARRFERVTDQVKNICEEIHYITTGEVIKHRGAGNIRILFMDDDNSFCSQLAEAIGNSLGFPQFSFLSAGIESSTLKPELFQFCADKGLDISKQVSKSFQHIPDPDSISIMVALSPKVMRAKLALDKNIIRIHWETKKYCNVKLTSSENRTCQEELCSYLNRQITDLVYAILGEKSES